MTISKPRNYRDAGSGEYVKESFAKRNPGKTVSEPRPPLKPSTPKKK